MTLVECAGALALAAIVVATTTTIGQASATLVRRVHVDNDAVSLVRNLLEHELGAPCGGEFDCPGAYRCSITRTAISAGTDRLSAHVERADGEATEDLATLAPPPACGG